MYGADMQLYNGGKVVLQRSSDEGIIEVVDIGDIRSLHFGTYPRQSSMSLRHPHSLELSYTRSMMACLLFNPRPVNILVVGLGGGSLVKFLLHHYPDCHVTVIEYRQDVIEVAQNFFGVPGKDLRLTILQGDGYQLVSEIFYRGEQQFDLLLVDAYDHEGMAQSVGVQVFFDACAGVLSPQGLMSINLWGSDRPSFNLTMQRINQSFQDQSLILPVAGKGNVIGLAFKQVVNPSQLKKLRALAEQLEDSLQTSLPQSLQQLIRQNQSFLNRLFL